MKKLSKLLLAVVLALGMAGCSSEEESSNAPKEEVIQVTVPDLSSMTSEEINQWASDNQVVVETKQEYSNDIEAGSFIEQSVAPEKTIKQGKKVVVTYSLGKEPSKEFKNALKSAESYSKMMHMSKRGIYDQLTSEYGEKFPVDAATWAIENLKADYNENALKSAKSYSDTMHMSKQGIYDQLISDYGEKFSEEEAQYAIDHLDVDYNENALKTAKNYQDMMNMSKSAIFDQLTSAYGEKFTAEQAQYAIDHLDD